MLRKKESWSSLFRPGSKTTSQHKCAAWGVQRTAFQQSQNSTGCTAWQRKAEDIAEPKILGTGAGVAGDGELQLAHIQPHTSQPSSFWQLCNAWWTPGRAGLWSSMVLAVPHLLRRLCGLRQGMATEETECCRRLADTSRTCMLTAQAESESRGPSCYLPSG